MRQMRASWMGLATALVVTVAAAGLSPGVASADVVTAAVTLDAGTAGRTFDGVGAISGGGGNSGF